MDDPQRLIDRYLTGRLGPDEVVALREWLKADPGHLRDFVIETYLNRGIHEILTSERVQAQECKPSDFDDAFRAIAEKQRETESANGRGKDHEGSREGSEDGALRAMLERAGSPTERLSIIEGYARRQLEVFLAQQQETGKQQEHPQRHIPRFSWDLRRAAVMVGTFFRVTYKMAVAASVLLVLGLVLAAGVHHWQAQRVVATLGDSRHARWTVPPGQTELRRGRFCLEEGWTQIKFVSGAEVILQAPCTFELDSSRSMFLESGQLTARVASPQARGFTVDTANSQLVDFGTEFGVLVCEGRDSEVHVFDGRVQLRTVYADRHKGDAQELTQGQRARVDQDRAVTIGQLEERLFHRSLPGIDSLGMPGKRLDLADILGGGNGFGTGRMECAINPLTGRAAVFNVWNYRKKGNGQYVRVEHNGFVDGVFIPDGGADRPVIVSSQGHVFQECPRTNNQADGEIQNTHASIVFHTPQMTCRPRLGDQVYDTVAHPHIYMQANVGITFDLDAMRGRLTAGSMQRFTARCGVCAEIPEEDEQVDFWVLIDGQTRFVRQDATKAQGAMQIDVPLYEQDRFLTLAVTQGADGSMWDLGLFAEPAIELGPVDKTPE